MKNPYQKNTPSHSVWQNGYNCAIQNKAKRCPYNQNSWRDIWNNGWDAGAAFKKNDKEIVNKKSERKKKS